MTAYTGRGYYFGVHGWSGYELRRFRRRNARSRHETNRPAPTLDTISLEDAIHHERLLEAFSELRREGGPAPGVDGLRFSDFSASEIAEVARGTARRIREGRYRPQPARPVPIPKASGGRRILRIRTVVDRMVGKALARRDVEFPVVPRAPNDLAVFYAAQPARLTGSEFVGAAQQALAQRSALVRAVVDDRVQGTGDVVYPDTELADVDQPHRARR